MSGNLVPTPIIDKNGKATTVNRKAYRAGSGSARISGLGSVTRASEDEKFFPVTNRSKCGNCEKRLPVVVASRMGGGNYRRAGKSYKTNICRVCARDLLDSRSPGFHSISRWDIIGLEHALAQFERNDAADERNLARFEAARDARNEDS